MSLATEPRFSPVDLTELMNDGVLMAANEQFFWPLGLALTWEVQNDLPDDEKVAGNLHIREWVYPDGHHETIETAKDDEVAVLRRHMFVGWLLIRIGSLPRGERNAAMVLLSKYQR